MEWLELDILGRRYRIAGQPDDKTFNNLPSVLRDQAPLNGVAAAALNPESQVCDIGANLGLSTLVLAGRVPKGKVYAFEPDPGTNTCLKATIMGAGLQNVKFFETALGAVRENVFLHSGDKFSAGSHIVTNRHISSGALPTSSVQMDTLDSVLEAAACEGLDLIKIDVEGFEIDILAGAKNTLRRFQPVVFLEMNSWCLIAFRNMNPRFFVEFLLDNFPFVFWVTPSGKLRRIGKAVRMHYFLHEHLVRHACNNDLVCCWRTEWLERFAPGIE
ncbi:MAG: FkbM family methyltransferase [Acetobacteraceae bacterium]